MISAKQAKEKTQNGLMMKVYTTKQMVDREIEIACSVGKSGVTLCIQREVIDQIDEYIKSHGFDTRVSKVFDTINVYW